MKRRTAALALALLAAGVVRAGDYVARMNTPFPILARHRLMNDYEDILRAPRRIALERRMQALERKNGTQVVFLSVRNTGAIGAAGYADAVFKAWDIGNNGQHNGVLFLVGNDDLGILRGPGMTGALPDVLLARVRKNLLVPTYQRPDMSDGVEAVLDALIKASEGEDTLPAARDYSHAVAIADDDLVTPERAWIAVLSTVFAGYAGMLLRRRLRASGAAA